VSSRSAKVSAYVFDRIGRTKKDFKLDTFRAGGKGGQHQNKTESGVRLTDLKTGLSAESREHREQLQNKNAAFNKLINLLIEHYTKAELADKVARIRAATEEIRVYKEAMHMVKDSATGHSADYRDTLNGKTLDGFIKARRLAEAQS
jgi:protein subunit release factor B